MFKALQFPSRSINVIQITEGTSKWANIRTDKSQQGHAWQYTQTSGIRPSTDLCFWQYLSTEMDGGNQILT